MSKISPFSAKAFSVGSSESLELPEANPSAMPSASADVTGEKAGPDKLRELEARMAVLEHALMEHAMVLRERIGIRLDRLEEKFRYEADGLRRALREESNDRHCNIVRLAESVTSAVDRVESRQRDSGVNAAMQDIIAALVSTRLHLDALAQAVEGTRRDMAS